MCLCLCRAVSAATLIAMATLSGSSTSLIPCLPAQLHCHSQSHHHRHRHSIPVGSNLRATFSKGNTALARLGKLTLPLPLLPPRRARRAAPVTRAGYLQLEAIGIYAAQQNCCNFLMSPGPVKQSASCLQITIPSSTRVSPISLEARLGLVVRRTHSHSYTLTHTIKASICE